MGWWSILHLQRRMAKVRGEKNTVKKKYNIKVLFNHVSVHLTFKFKSNLEVKTWLRWQIDLGKICWILVCCNDKKITFYGLLLDKNVRWMHHISSHHHVCSVSELFGVIKFSWKGNQENVEEKNYIYRSTVLNDRVQECGVGRELKTEAKGAHIFCYYLFLNFFFRQFF